MIVEPAEKDLIRGKSQKIINSLSVLAKSVEFGMELDIDLGQKTPSDDLPNETKD